MSSMFLLVVTCMMIASVSAGNYCCTPNEWEGNIGLVIGTYTNKTGTYIEGGIHIAFDATNRIVASNQNLNINGQPLQQRIVSDYNQNVAYLITAAGCRRSLLSGWIPNCIPDNATESSFHYGLAGNMLNSKSYFVKYGAYDIYFIVTADTCVPVAEDLVGIYNGVEMMQTMVYTDIKAGITNRDLFAIPATCALSPIGPEIPGLRLPLKLCRFPFTQ